MLEQAITIWKRFLVLDAVSASNGVSSTVFIGYKPDRSCQFSVELSDKKATFSSSILSTTLTSDCTRFDDVLSNAFKHTGYGSGQAFRCSAFSFFAKEDGKKRFIRFYDEVSTKVIEEYLFLETFQKY